MANQEYLKILDKGVKEWNLWRKENPDIRPNLVDADLSNRNLRKVNFSRANLDGVNLNKSDLKEANLNNASLIHAKLKKAILIKANLQSVNLFKANLSGTNFRWAKLLRALLHNTNMEEANLYGTNLFEAQLDYSNLTGAEVSRANLFRANMEFTNLSEANLEGTKLYQARFIGANLNQTELTNAKLGGTLFAYSDLSTCRGLRNVIVTNNCSIDFETLQKSKNLPKEFLLKIGLPENYIEYIPDFYEEKTLRLFPVFLSHSWANKDFAKKLYDALINRGVQVWYDEKEMKPGDNIYEGISKGINVFDKMILVCSKGSLNSWWVDQEMNRIFKKEREYQKANGKKLGLLIPITVDDTIWKWEGAKGEAIRDSVIGDFTEWKDESKFEQSLNDLIEALNVDRGGKDIPSFI